MFRDWQRRLPGNVEVCAIEYAGRGRRIREAPFRRMDHLVAELGEALLPACRAPFVLYGHSVGALAAFETARFLRACGVSPALLLVSGSRAPHTRSIRQPVHHLPDAELLGELRRLNGTPPEFFANDELVQCFLPSIRADFQLDETYLYRPEPPLACPIAAFGGTDDPCVDSAGLDSWRDLTRASFSLHMLPGNHFFINSSVEAFLAVMHGLLEGLGSSNHPLSTPKVT